LHNDLGPTHVELCLDCSSFVYNMLEERRLSFSKDKKDDLVNIKIGTEVYYIPGRGTVIDVKKKGYTKKEWKLLSTLGTKISHNKQLFIINNIELAKPCNGSLRFICITINEEKKNGN